MKMDPDRYEALRRRVADFDAKMRRLSNLGVDLRRPTQRMLEDLRARRNELQRQHEELGATQSEADRLLLADLLDLYINGDDPDREWLRRLLKECRAFRWGLGWGLAGAVTTTDDARKALAVMSMKDGDGDYRDAIVALDRLCAVMEKAGLPVAALLTEAASWSSDVSWFPPMSSMRTMLLARAERFPANR